MKDLIICLAVNSRDNYVECLKGLEESLIYWQGDVRIYKEFPEGCRHQSEVPYAFKYDLIAMARKDGYKRIFWVDSTMRLVQGNSISHLLDEAPKGVVAFHNLGHETSSYITDMAVLNLGCESYLKDIKNTWGGAIGFDFNLAIACEVFDEMLHQSNIGTFDNGVSSREEFLAARHDQSCLAVLLHQYGVKLLDYGKIVSAEHSRTKEYGNDYYIIYGD